MKRFIMLLLAGTLLLSGCAAGVELTVPEAEVESVEGLAFYTDKLYYPTQGAQIKAYLKNDTGTEYTYGSEFSLELMTENGWRQVAFKDDNVAWTAELYTLPANGAGELDAYLDYIYEGLPEGEYRLVKRLNTEEGEGVYIGAEFALTESKVLQNAR